MDEEEFDNEDIDDNEGLEDGFPIFYRRQPRGEISGDNWTEHMRC